MSPPEQTREQTRSSSEAQQSKPPVSSSRRRDKPQLSCNACRRRKIRCDRLFPCSNCSIRGPDSSCVYPHTIASNLSAAPNNAAQGQAPANVQDRINKLESLVLDLMHRASPSSDSSPLPATQWTPPERGCLSGTHHLRPNAESDAVAVSEPEPRRDLSPSPSDYGSFRHKEKVVSYVSSSHWAAVLNSITDLRNHLTQEDDTTPQVPELTWPATEIVKPQLFYSGQLDDTVASIIRCLPPRPIVDRLLSRYFTVLDIAPGVVHSGQFLIEYEEFWSDPESVPIAWIGLLFSIVCLSTHLQHASSTQPVGPALAPAESDKSCQLTENERLIELYKSQSIKCLLLSRWTKGGPYVLETLILYFLVECFHLKDMEIGIWVLVGNIVQIAIHMGYHRDAKHFPSISPFAGEMRRRVWAMILQLDFSVSTQLGLPRLVREQNIDTQKPRNLNDMDFGINTSKLPESRPETEFTPTLYVLAKLRLLDVGAKVADVATELQPHSYSDILHLDQEIYDARDSLPPILKWTGLALDVSSQTMIQRIWLEVICQQLRIVLHKKFLDPSRPQQQFGYSRSACLNAAMKILELQRLVDEEIQTDGLLYQSRWRVSSAFNDNFLLATSVLCFYLKTYSKPQKRSMDDSPRDVAAEPASLDNVQKALQQAQRIWIRQCADSKEAKKAVTALYHVLGPAGTDSEVRTSYNTQNAPADPFLFTSAISNFPEYNFNAATFASVDGFNWQEFPADLVQSNEQGAGAGDMQQMDFSD